MIDKNGKKRWISDINQQKARERMLAYHQNEKSKEKKKPRKKRSTAVKSVQQIESVNEAMLKKYQDDLLKVVQHASLQAVEQYDSRRKARKAEKKTKRQVEQVNKELNNKLSGIQQQRQPPKYGEPGFFDQCF